MALKKETTDLVDVIRPTIVIKNGVVSTSNDNLYKELLMQRTGVELEDAQKVADFNRDFAVATHHASGLEAIEAFKKDKKLEDVTGEFKLTEEDILKLNFKRTAHGTAAGKDWTKHCYSSTDFVTMVGDSSRGQFKASRAALNEAAAEAYGN